MLTKSVKQKTQWIPYIDTWQSIYLYDQIIIILDVILTVMTF